ncbi:MAG: histidine phosphatase family protein [Propionibacteriaceae bacterium]|jgi:probable phosphoglycerate mutase|nr:histidine phosphatase family protein [Propionibacteriaceae bacterium]
MTVLYLVRHGETQWSRQGRYTSVSDVALTADGQAQAEHLRSRLQADDFGLVLASPRLRAQQTAELAGFRPIIDPDLAEWFYGEFEGLTRAELDHRSPDWHVWRRDPPGGETAAQVEARLTRVVERVQASGVDRAICFSHGHALRVLACAWIGLSLRHGGALPLDPASISVLGYDDTWPAILRWNLTD